MNTSWIARIAENMRSAINLSAALATAIFVASPITAPSAKADPVATPPPVATQRDSHRTRFVVGLERKVEIDVLALTNPNRVVIELPDIKMRLPEVEGTTSGLVKSLRAGLSAPGRQRIVIDVAAPVVVERADTEKEGKSFKLVMDLVPAAFSKSAGVQSKKLRATAGGPLQPPTPRPALTPQERAARSYRPVVVIDPGHGGHDSGAIKNGVVEKDAVLAFSKVLRDKLKATGRYRVVMTRDSDEFIPLDERRAIAERQKAALFIAVHADYARSRASGATIYSLTDSTANALQRSARAEVARTVLSGQELAAVQKTSGDASAIQDILADLAQREVAVTKERTSMFARSVIEFMGASTNMRENADREANFRVLKTAKVPSVLIELAYVTNAQDARNLQSQAWRNKVSDSIATAVENYFSNQIARLPM